MTAKYSRLIKDNIFNKKQSLRQAALLYIFVDIIGKLIIFIKSIWISSHLGFSKINDTYNYANQVFSSYQNLFMDAFFSGTIPYLNQKENLEAKQRFISSTLLVIILFMTMINLPLIFFFKPIINYIAPGFESAQISLVFKFYIFIFLNALLNVITRMADSYLKTEKKFALLGLTGIISSLFNLFILILLLSQSYLFLVLSNLFSTLLAVVIYLRYVPSKWLGFDWEVLHLLRFSAPLLVAQSIGVLHSVIEKGLASTLSTGAVTALAYAYLIYNSVAGLVTAVSGVSYAFISEHISQDNQSALRLHIRKLGKVFTLSFAFVNLIFLLIGKQALYFVYLHGKVQAADLEHLHTLVALYFPMLFTHSMATILFQTMFSSRKSLIPTVISSLSFGLNITLNLFFIGKYGSYALAASSSISSFFLLCISQIYVYYYYRLFIFQAWHIATFLVSLALIPIFLIYPLF